MLKIILTGLLAAAISLPAASSNESRKRRLQPQLVELWRVEESLAIPESAIYDSQRDVIYVSNINGQPTAKDGNGYITRVSEDGEVLDEQWVDGLNAPKGMAISGDHLYVSDIDSLVEISLETQQVTNVYPAEGALFLNDVAADRDGNIYVSDTARQTIYRLQGGEFEVWVDDPQISQPNGLFARNNRLIVAAGDTSTEDPGSNRFLQSINLRNKKIRRNRDNTPLGSIDGVERSNFGGFFLTDPTTGDISHFTRRNGAVVLESPEPGTADLGFNREDRIIYVPILFTSKLIAYKVLWCR